MFRRVQIRIIRTASDIWSAQSSRNWPVDWHIGIAVSRGDLELGNVLNGRRKIGKLMFTSHFQSRTSSMNYTNFRKTAAVATSRR